jgi:hypothetical protein
MLLSLSASIMLMSKCHLKEVDAEELHEEKCSNECRKDASYVRKSI